MPPGATRTIAATYAVAKGTSVPPEITNTATVFSGVSDPDAANNSATITTMIGSRAKCDVDGDGVDEIVTGAGPFGALTSACSRSAVERSRASPAFMPTTGRSRVVYSWRAAT
jgi:hypothetical protein